MGGEDVLVRERLGEHSRPQVQVLLKSGIAGRRVVYAGIRARTTRAGRHLGKGRSL